MTTFDETMEHIAALAARSADLQREAATHYGPEVAAIISSGCRDVQRIERTLDGLLDFAADEACLRLFRRLCRHYWTVDPAATACYVHAYREMWDAG